MVKRILILVLILTTANVATSKEEFDCMTDLSKTTEDSLKSKKPVFDPNAKNIEKIFPAKLIKYGFEEVVKLKNGIEVTFSAGGCVHYGYSFTFEGKKINRIKPNEKLNRAIALLKSIKTTNKSETNQFLNALNEAKKKSLEKESNNTINLPCGDAICELIDQGNEKVKITYSFAL